eukprot:Em0016g562a
MNTAVVLIFVAELSARSYSYPVLPGVSTGRLPQTNASCDPGDCLIPVCADPAPPAEDDCCPRCDNSSCLFKGCVRWNSLGAQWLPDPCTVCSCRYGRPTCSRVECQVPSCFGFPTTIKAGRCCAECDFGIATNSCQPIPYRKETVSVYTAEGGPCVTEVLMHKCDKSIVVQNSQTYACSGELILKNLSTKTTDCFAQNIAYKDVVICKLKPILVMDYEPDPYSCPLYIP